MIAPTRISRLKTSLGALTLLLGCSADSDSQQHNDEPLDHGQPTASATVQLPQAVADSAVVSESEVSIHADAAEHADAKALVARIDAYLKSQQKSARPEPVYFVANRAAGTASEDGTIDVNAGNPFGVARKAVGYRYEEGALILETEPASLEQVIGDADLGGEIVLDREPTEKGLSGGTSGTSSLPSIPLIDLTGRELYTGDLGVIKLGPTFVQASATIDYGLKVASSRLQSAHLAIHGELTTQLVLEAQLAGAFEKSFEKEVFSTHIALPPAGPVALSLRTSLKAGCRVSARASLRGNVGFKVVADATVGFDYERDREKPLQGMGNFGLPKHEIMGPEFDPEGHAEIYCYLEPKFAVLYFASVGPHNSFQTGVDMQFNAPPPSLRMDLKSTGAVGGEVKLFSFELADFYVPVFDHSMTVYEGYPNPPAAEN